MGSRSQRAVGFDEHARGLAERTSSCRLRSARDRGNPENNRLCPTMGGCLAIVTVLIGALVGGCGPAENRATFDGRPVAQSESQATVADQDEGTLAPLRVHVFEDAALARVIRREWRAHSQQPIELNSATKDELPQAAINTDVVIFPSAWLGAMVVQRHIAAWPSELGPSGQSRRADRKVGSAPDARAAYDWPDVFPALRRQELKWGDQIYGVSFGSPIFVLMYRKDLFDRWQLTPPRTWSEYTALAAALRTKIAQGGDGGGPTYATLEPLAPGWAARTLIARAASYVRHPNQYSTFFNFSSMEPLIDEPPFQRALGEQKASLPAASGEPMNWTPAQVTSRFLGGEAAMVISWPSGAAVVDETREASRDRSTRAQVAGGDPADRLPADAEFAITRLPGSRQAYQFSSKTWQDRAEIQSVSLLGTAGRVGAIARQVRSLDTATSFLMWLTGEEQASRISSGSRATTLFRNSLMRRSSVWVEAPLAAVAGQFTEIVVASQSRGNPLQMLRVPGQEDYVQVLDQAARSALSGSTDVADALNRAATAWSQLTAARGIDQAREEYRSSLGL